MNRPDLNMLEQQAGELACLLHMAAELAVHGDDGADAAALWKLRCLLAALCLTANALHDAAGAAAHGGA